MGSMSIVHWMIVVGIVVLLFGKHKISDVMSDVAHGIKSFKKGMSDDEIASAGAGHEQSEGPVGTSNVCNAVRAHDLTHFSNETTEGLRK